MAVSLGVRAVTVGRRVPTSALGDGPPTARADYTVAQARELHGPYGSPPYAWRIAPTMLCPAAERAGSRTATTAATTTAARLARTVHSGDTNPGSKPRPPLAWRRGRASNHPTPTPATP